MALPTVELAEPGVNEVRSAVGSVVGNLIAILRTIINHVANIIQRVVNWAGEHPEAFSMMMINLIILFS